MFSCCNTARKCRNSEQPIIPLFEFWWHHVKTNNYESEAKENKISHTPLGTTKLSMQSDLYYINTTNYKCYSTKRELTKRLKLSLDTRLTCTRVTRIKALLEIPEQPKKHMESRRQRKHQSELWNALWPEDPPHILTYTPSRVWEKHFPLLKSFLSQRKTTLKPRIKTYKCSIIFSLKFQNCTWSVTDLLIFEETWNFLDRRMSDIGMLISAKETVSFLYFCG